MEHRMRQVGDVKTAVSLAEASGFAEGLASIRGESVAIETVDVPVSIPRVKFRTVDPEDAKEELAKEVAMN